MLNNHNHSEHSSVEQNPHKRMMDDFKKRFWISMVLTVPVLALSPMVQSFFGLEFIFMGQMYILFVLSSAAYFYGGWPFIKGLYSELKNHRPGMMTLIGLAITVAYVYSSLVVFGLEGMVFYWELVTLIDIMLLGHWIEMRSVMGASKALEELAKIMPSTAHRLDAAGNIEDVPLQKLEKGQTVLVRPGEKLPVDGKIVEGVSEIDLSMITGESRPVSKQEGDEVIGGSVNGTGSLKVEITKTGSESYLAKVIDLVKKAGQSKSRAQSLADKAAFILTIIAISAGVVTLVFWLFFGKAFDFALERMATVMVITCPHALGLAIPLVIAVTTAISARNGLLIRKRIAFEAAYKIDTIIFDKTGTLTTGKFSVTDIVPFSGADEKNVLKLAASIETNSEHTIAASIVRAAQDRDIEIKQTMDFKAIPGKGASASVDGDIVYIGNEGVLETAGINDQKANDKTKEMASQGKTVVFVVSQNKILGLIALADTIRPESRQAIEELRKENIEVAMITGDNEDAARNIAEQLGLDIWFAGVLPDRKSQKIAELQKQNKKVAMVGDGINDAPALATADLGIAIGTGTDVAAETADVVLVENDPRDVLAILRLSRINRRKTIQNLAWATGYNVVAIPLAAGVLYSFGFIMPPAVGAVIMSLSTIVVAVNAKLIHFEKKTALYHG